MYCTKCGSENDNNASKCANCGEVLRQTTPAQGSIPNYLVQAILVTLFCCLPFGIVAIVFAAQVNGKIQAGDIQGAMAASSSAKMWCWVSFGLGLAVAVLYIAFTVLFGVLAGAAGHH